MIQAMQSLGLPLSFTGAPAYGLDKDGELDVKCRMTLRNSRNWNRNRVREGALLPAC